MESGADSVLNCDLHSENHTSNLASQTTQPTLPTSMNTPSVVSRCLFSTPEGSMESRNLSALVGYIGVAPLVEERSSSRDHSHRR